ncbi:hypothetical protein XELAEV_18041149mg [Xenopus laevis]|uniref:Uncharacterized protein n=1 Tax=Xenopus laevis TaxID=8355 RepID=A0A974C260_XENLA|nr:hypothetical protein XELAEV_18041149mg [Xenopus laevis]
MGGKKKRHEVSYVWRARENVVSPGSLLSRNKHSTVILNNNVLATGSCASIKVLTGALVGINKKRQR